MLTAAIVLISQPAFADCANRWCLPISGPYIAPYKPPPAPQPVSEDRPKV